jgi:hypothetical protein
MCSLSLTRIDSKLTLNTQEIKLPALVPNSLPDFNRNKMVKKKFHTTNKRSSELSSDDTVANNLAVFNTQTSHIAPGDEIEYPLTHNNHKGFYTDLQKSVDQS